MAAEKKDILMDDAPDAAATPSTTVFSDQEKHILALYDRLQASELDLALLRARLAYKEDTSRDKPNETPAEQSVEAAQKRLLEARAAYVLRNTVVESTLTVHPILRTVHGASDASPVERDLLPALEQRDAVSLAVAREATARRAALDAWTTTAAKRLHVERQNAQLAAEARALAAVLERSEQVAEDDAAASSSQQDKDALAQAKTSLKTSRQRWKLIKGAASAIVAGSGVDWTQDAALQELVLDPA